jgi:hypothetical protein
MAEGISTRHSRSCAKKRGGERCSCQPSYIPWVSHPGKGGKVYGKTTKSQAEAKAWRVDALRALNQKTLTVPTKQTIKQAADEFLEAAESGQVRNRSGDQYKPSVVRSYRGSLRRYVFPAPGPRTAVRRDTKSRPRPSGLPTRGGLKRLHGSERDHAAPGDLPEGGPAWRRCDQPDA